MKFSTPLYYTDSQSTTVWLVPNVPAKKRDFQKRMKQFPYRFHRTTQNWVKWMLSEPNQAGNKIVEW